VESLRGHLLVAGPGLVDPNFWRTVVLVGEHSDEGALGLVLNRSSETTVDEALPEFALLAEGMGAVHVGGPVQPSAVVVLGDFVDIEMAESLVVGSIGFLPAEVEPATIGELSRARVYVGMRVGARVSSGQSSRKARGSSSPLSPRTSSRTIRTGSGAACSGGRAAHSDSSRRCHQILPGTEFAPM